MGKQSGTMSGGKPVLVSVMYSARARIMWGSVDSVASRPREETAFNRRFRALVQAGQVRMACWNDSGSISQQGHVMSGSSLNQEGLAAR